MKKKKGHITLKPRHSNTAPPQREYRVTAVTGSMVTINGLPIFKDNRPVTAGDLVTGETYDITFPKGYKP